MKRFLTEIKAIDPVTGALKCWQGPHVPGFSSADAQVYCNSNGLGYCKVLGELIAEGELIDGKIENMIDYEAASMN